MFKPPISDLDCVVEDTVSDLKQIAGQHIFLTGAAGFLGRHLTAVIAHANSLHDLNISLTGVDNFVSSGAYGVGQVGLKGFNFNFEQLDANSNRVRMKELASDADLVIHAAGIASPTHYKANPLATLDVAINGCRDLLEVCAETNGKFVFFSSSEIYGDPAPDQIPTPETYNGNVSSVGPRACYDESKRVGETLCSVFNKYHGVHTNVIRPFNVYGPGMQSTDYRVMPNFIFRALAGRSLQVYGTGNQTRTYCYVTDALTGFVKVFCNGRFGEVYNIGNPSDEISAKDLADYFVKSIKSDVAIEVIDHPSDYPSDEPSRRCPDITKAKQHLDYHPRVSVSEGIKRFYVFAEEHFTE